MKSCLAMIVAVTMLATASNASACCLPILPIVPTNKCTVSPLCGIISIIISILKPCPLPILPCPPPVHSCCF